MVLQTEKVFWTLTRNWAVGVFCVVGFAFIGGEIRAEKEAWRTTAFAEGEVLEYDLKWSVFSVGRATLEVLPMETRGAEPSWHFVFEARTNAFADPIFKVRTRIDSWVSADLERTLRYEERKREGKTKRDIVVEFDHEAGTATYSNFGNAKEPIKLGESPILDPLGAIYHLRARLTDRAAGAPVALTVTDGKKAVPLRLQPQKRERIRVKGRRWETLRYVPETGELGGVFEKSEDARLWIWVSAATGAHPVQVEGEVVVGSFWAKLRPPEN